MISIYFYINIENQISNFIMNNYLKIDWVDIHKKLYVSISSLNPNFKQMEKGTLYKFI